MEQILKMTNYINHMTHEQITQFFFVFDLSIPQYIYLVCLHE